MWYVYVLLCSNKSLYTGISTDPKKRLSDHQKGIGGKYTRSFRPLRILHLESLKTRKEALKRESEIKGWPRKKKIHMLGLNKAVLEC